MLVVGRPPYEMDETMNDRFAALLSWWNEGESVDFEEVESQVRIVLSQHNIRLRQDDGYLVQINFSLPQSHSGLVLGLRYRKRDGTLTEDHFLCVDGPEGVEITPYYTAALEELLAEYRGTHKQQVDIAAAWTSLPSGGVPILVNTISVARGIK